MFDVDKLSEVIRYDPDTGELIWLKQIGRRAKVGERAGTLHPNGYRYVRVMGRNFREHRLAFLLMGMEIPKYVDHINGIKDDNKWGNLRACTHSDNIRNVKLRADNKSGFKGVYENKEYGGWNVCVNIGTGNTKFFGRFLDIELAELVANEVREKYHGEYARHE